MLRHVTKRIFIAGLGLILATLACNLDVKMPTVPTPPIANFTPSASEADAFEQAFTQAISQASSTQTFNITITQTQFSSWLALRAGDYAQKHGSTWPLKNVQATFIAGAIHLYGVISQQNLPDTPADIVFTPAIDPTGQLIIQFNSGQLGIVGIPTALMDGINQEIKNILTTQLSQIKGKYQLTTLQMNGGNLTISGKITP